MEIYIRNSWIFETRSSGSKGELEWFFGIHFKTPFEELPVEFIEEAIKNQHREFIGDKTEPFKIKIQHNTKHSVPPRRRPKKLFYRRNSRPSTNPKSKVFEMLSPIE